MKGERNHLVDQVHAERAAEVAAAEARKNLPPVERVRAAQEHLNELKEIREAKIKIEAKMELLGRAFRDMGIATALAGAVETMIEGLPTIPASGDLINDLDANETKLRILAGKIDIIKQITDKLALPTETGRHFEFQTDDVQPYKMYLWSVDDLSSGNREIALSEEGSNGEKAAPLEIDLIRFPWDNSTPEGQALIRAIEEAFPESAEYIQYEEKQDLRIDARREAERQNAREKYERQEKADAVAAEEARVKAVKDAKTKARIAKLQKELKGE